MYIVNGFKNTISMVAVSIYTVYLVNNKFGELGCYAHWQTFLFGEQGNIECTLFIIGCDYK